MEFVKILQQRTRSVKIHFKINLIEFMRHQSHEGKYLFANIFYSNQFMMGLVFIQNVHKLLCAIEKNTNSHFFFNHVHTKLLKNSNSEP